MQMIAELMEEYGQNISIYRYFGNRYRISISKVTFAISFFDTFLLISTSVIIRVLIEGEVNCGYYIKTVKSFYYKQSISSSSSYDVIANCRQSPSRHQLPSIDTKA